MRALALVGKFGRLGNQLWTYANVLAYSLEHGIELVNVSFDAASLFTQPSKVDTLRTFVRASAFAEKAIRSLYRINLRTRVFPFVQTGESDAFDMDASGELEALITRAGVVFLSGFYFCAPVSVSKRRLDLVNHFTPAPLLNSEANSLVDRARGRGSLLVGIHIRQGDYRTFCKGLMFYKTSEYVDVMRAIVEQRPENEVRFLVCSDERQDLSRFDGLPVTVSTSAAVVDMYALARCDLIIGPSSTFSQWASFYGNVPLHVLDWRAAEQYHPSTAIRRPRLDRDFNVFSAASFSRFSSRHVSLDQILVPGWLGGFRRRVGREDQPGRQSCG
jgi:hypothetical protein